MIIRPSEVIYAIEILVVNKACGPDLIAGHLKYDNQKDCVTCFVLQGFCYMVCYLNLI